MPAMEYESEYGIDVGNRFAGLSSEIDDPMELIQMAQQKEKALKTEKKQAKGAKGAQKSQEKAQPTAVKETVIEDIKKEGLFEAYFEFYQFKLSSLAAEVMHVLWANMLSAYLVGLSFPFIVSLLT